MKRHLIFILCIDLKSNDLISRQRSLGRFHEFNVFSSVRILQTSRLLKELYCWSLLITVRISLTFFLATAGSLVGLRRMAKASRSPPINTNQYEVSALDIGGDSHFSRLEISCCFSWKRSAACSSSMYFGCFVGTALPLASLICS